MSCAILWLKRSSNCARLRSIHCSNVSQREAVRQSTMASRLTRALWSHAFLAAAVYAAGSDKYALTSAHTARDQMLCR